MIPKQVPVAAAIIIKDFNDGPKLLLIRRSKTDTWGMVWEFPRGKCDKGDKTLGDCLKREVKEETGLDVKIVNYIDKYKYVADGGERISTQFNFLCEVIDENQKVQLSHEHDGYKWVSSGGEVELLVPQEMKRVISKVFTSMPSYNYTGVQRIEEEYKLHDYPSYK